MKLTAFSAFAILLCTLSSTGSAETLQRKLYPVDQNWLTRTFSDKTWTWNNGHAYFSSNNEFQATIGRTQAGQGQWYTAGDGKLCFRGTWTSATGTGPAKKCWKHAIDQENQIWQALLDGSPQLNWSRFDPQTELIPGNIYGYRFDYATGRKAPIRAQPMDAKSVATMYAGKTWKWDDGHAYFGAGGVLTAVADGNAIGEGRWYATRNGSICIDATWRSTEYGSVSNKRCWVHAQDANGSIWQSEKDKVWGWVSFDPSKDLEWGDVYAERFAQQKQNLGR